MYRSLRQDREVEGLRRRVAAVRAGDLPRWGVMSATEMMAHLRGAFRMSLGELAATAEPGSLPPAVLKVLALWVPMRWPQGVPTVAELRQGTSALQTDGFAEVQGEVDALLVRFAGSRLRTRHPMLGAMGQNDWMRWGFLHTDHHLRQFGQ